MSLTPAATIATSTTPAVPAAAPVVITAAYEQLWTIATAAEYLCMSVDTAQPLLVDVAVHFSPRCVRYFPEDVRTFAMSRRGTKPAKPATAVDTVRLPGGVVRRIRRAA